MENEEVKLVKMHSDIPVHPKGPTEMDCHPDNVSEMLALGWVIVQDQEEMQGVDEGNEVYEQDDEEPQVPLKRSRPSVRR